MWIAVMAWTAENRVSKYQAFDTQAEVEAHIASHVASYPDAFSASDPGGSSADWLVDPVAKTLSNSPDPDRVRETKLEELNAAYEQARALGVTFDGVTRAIDDKANERLNYVVNIINSGKPQPPKTMMRDIDGVRHKRTDEQWKDHGEAIAIRITELDDWWSLQFDKIRNASDPGSVVIDPPPSPS